MSKAQRIIYVSNDCHSFVTLYIITTFRLVTAPFYTISMSMQLSVTPHLTIYGDVKESEIKKPNIVREKLEGLGLIESKKAETKEITMPKVDLRHDLMKAEVGGDLMKASG